MAGVVFYVSICVLGFALVQKKLATTPITGPIIFVALGLLAGSSALGILEVSTGEGDDTFAENPPNALLSVADGSIVSNAIVALGDPQLPDGDLSYAIDLSDGSLTPADGPVTVVIA